MLTRCHQRTKAALLKRPRGPTRPRLTMNGKQNDIQSQLIPRNEMSDEQANKSPTKRSSTVIVGDSTISRLNGWKMGSRNNRVAVHSFTGATIEEIEEQYIQPTLKSKPDTIILHAGTNNLKTDDPHAVAEKLIKITWDDRTEVSRLHDCNLRTHASYRLQGPTFRCRIRGRKSTIPTLFLSLARLANHSSLRNNGQRSKLGRPPLECQRNCNSCQRHSRGGSRKFRNRGP